MESDGPQFFCGLFCLYMKFSESLKKNEDFRAVYHRGRSAADRRLVVYCLENGMEKNRLGISASRKYGNSVERHRFQRRIREIYRLRENCFVRGIDLVVIARTDAANSDYHELEHSFEKLTSRLHAVGVDK